MSRGSRLSIDAVAARGLPPSSPPSVMFRLVPVDTFNHEYPAVTTIAVPSGPTPRGGCCASLSGTVYAVHVGGLLHHFKLEVLDAADASCVLAEGTISVSRHWCVSGVPQGTELFLSYTCSAGGTDMSPSKIRPRSGVGRVVPLAGETRHLGLPLSRPSTAASGLGHRPRVAASQSSAPNGANEMAGVGGSSSSLTRPATSSSRAAGHLDTTAAPIGVHVCLRSLGGISIETLDPVEIVVEVEFAGHRRRAPACGLSTVSQKMHSVIFDESNPLVFPTSRFNMTRVIALNVQWRDAGSNADHVPAARVLVHRPEPIVEGTGTQDTGYRGCNVPGHRMSLLHVRVYEEPLGPGSAPVGLPSSPPGSPAARSASPASALSSPIASASREALERTKEKIARTTAHDARAFQRLAAVTAAALPKESVVTAVGDSVLLAKRRQSQLSSGDIQLTGRRPSGVAFHVAADPASRSSVGPPPTVLVSGFDVGSVIRAAVRESVDRGVGRIQKSLQQLEERVARLEQQSTDATVSDAGTRRMLAFFDDADDDGDGYVALAEARMVCRHATPFYSDATEEEIDAFLRRCHVPAVCFDDGVVSRSDFNVVAARLAQL